jgi:hypothetical protein
VERSAEHHSAASSGNASSTKYYVRLYTLNPLSKKHRQISSLAIFHKLLTYAVVDAHLQIALERCIHICVLIWNAINNVVIDPFIHYAFSFDLGVLNVCGCGRFGSYRY